MTPPSSLCINPSLSPPYLCSVSISSFSFEVSSFTSSRTKPVSLTCKRFDFVRASSLTIWRRKQIVLVKADNNNNSDTNNDMTITEVREEEDESQPLIESENNARPRRIALFVEPSPFA